jgi:hypothetical protein
VPTLAEEAVNEDTEDTIGGSVDAEGSVEGWDALPVLSTTFFSSSLTLPLSLGSFITNHLATIPEGTEEFIDIDIDE